MTEGQKQFFLNCSLPRKKSAAKQGYGRRWQNSRKLFLKKNPLCVTCKAEGVLIEATHVDHIKPHRGDMTLFWNQNNWQSLCASCHSKKTNKQDGGFGNTRASVKAERRKKYASFGNVYLDEETQGGGEVNSKTWIGRRTGANPWRGFREINTGG